TFCCHPRPNSFITLILTSFPIDKERQARKGRKRSGHAVPKYAHIHLASVIGLIVNWHMSLGYPRIFQRLKPSHNKSIIGVGLRKWKNRLGRVYEYRPGVRVRVRIGVRVRGKMKSIRLIVRRLKSLKYPGISERHMP